MLSVGCLVVALTRPLLMLVTIGAVSQPGLALCGRTDWLRPPPPDTTDTTIPAKHIVIYADKLNHKVQDLLLFCTLLAQPEAPMCQMCPQCAEIGAMIDTWHCTVGWAGQQCCPGGPPASTTPAPVDTWCCVILRYYGRTRENNIWPPRDCSSGMTSLQRYFGNIVSIIITNNRYSLFILLSQLPHGHGTFRMSSAKSRTSTVTSFCRA